MVFSRPLIKRNSGITVINPAKNNIIIFIGISKEKSLLPVLKIKNEIIKAIGKIKRLSINSPTSVSTFIIFLSKLYELQKIATRNPTHGNEFRLKSKYTDDRKTAAIDTFLFKLSFSFKKIYPKKTLSIGNIK